LSDTDRRSANENTHQNDCGNAGSKAAANGREHVA
jgi:hypothetical protein